jgi:hypothetical protein
MRHNGCAVVHRIEHGRELANLGDDERQHIADHGMHVYLDEDLIVGVADGVKSLRDQI